MSLFEKYFAGWRFRSRTPSYEPGDDLVANVTGDDGGTSIVRIGDTHLELDESVPADTRIRLRVTDFDPATHRGQAELLAVLDTYEF
jgi:hypothetical protein